MAQEGLKRRLTAILSADVEGYSRLMRDDEEDTIQRLTAYRTAMTILIQQYRGRVVDAPGDNLLAEFGSVVDAVNCAVELQRELAERNAELSEQRRMQFRIGINLGDVLEEGDQIYGDGVNIAARMESLAKPGGICISGTVYDSIVIKLGLEYEYLGEQVVKNIPEPIRSYRVLSYPGAAAHRVVKASRAAQKKWRSATLAMAAVLIVAVGTAGIWYVLMHPTSPSIETVAEKKMTFPPSDRPSIAVLPLSNLSGDPEQEYFSNGITNDLITALSKFGELLVISSNTIFTYKGKPINIENVGQDLGVMYVLEGSVQRAGAKVRVNSQLIDAVNGFHIWSERYDRELKDIFAVQDEIVQNIVGKLAVKIDTAERKRVMHKKTESLEAYDYLLRGMEYLRRRTRSENIIARQIFEKAIELDPDFASAYVGLGDTYSLQAEYGWTEFPTQALHRAKELALKALSLEESLADAYGLLGNVYTYFEQYDLAINQLNRAIQLNPNDASSLGNRGQVLLWSGRVNDAIHSLETAFRFDPNMSPVYFMFLGIGYYLKGQYDRAINLLEEGLSRQPDWAGNHIILAAAYAQSGRSDDAEREAQEILRLDPFFNIDNYGTVFRNQADRDKIVQGLRKAGLN